VKYAESIKSVYSIGGNKVKTQIQLSLLKGPDPRIIQILLIGLALALALFSPNQGVYACPTGGGGGCSGG
jgi:hypothetical protein